MRRFAALMMAAALLGGCTQSQPDKPVFGNGEAPEQDARALAKAKAAAGIEACPPTTASSVSVDGLPALALECLGGGRSVQLAGLLGKPHVLNLWASWCKPCREELPLLAQVDKAFGDRLQVIGIDFADDAPDKAIDLAARSGVTYPLLADPKSSVKTSLRVVGLPQTVFVDEQGIIVATERRAYDSYEDLTDAIDEHLGVKP